MQSVLYLDSRNTNTLNALRYIETLRDDYNITVDSYHDSSIIYSKKTTTLNELAFVYIRSGNLDEAATAYLQVVDINPKNFDALVGLITTYTQQGFPESDEQFTDELDNLAVWRETNSLNRVLVTKKWSDTRSSKTV